MGNRSLKEKIIALILDDVDKTITDTNISILAEATFARTGRNPSTNADANCHSNDNTSECPIVTELCEKFFPKFLTSVEEMDFRRLVYYQLGRTLAHICMSFDKDGTSGHYIFYAWVLSNIDPEITRLNHVS